MSKGKWIIGVDEAGRGPLAGPVAVGVVLAPSDTDWAEFGKVKDSKCLSEKAREQVFNRVVAVGTEREVFYYVSLVPAATIDREGIVPAIKAGVEGALAAVLGQARITPGNVSVLLDGSLSAPLEFADQKTIIKGDALEPIISLASIMAKVTRDTYMYGLESNESLKPYQLGTHKGYGTKRHREAIKRYGLSPEHRVSFCRKVLRII